MKMTSEEISTADGQVKEVPPAGAPISESIAEARQKETSAGEQEAQSRDHGQRSEAKDGERAEGELEDVGYEKSEKGAPAQKGQQLRAPEWRKSSTVSFKDVAELFEIDLEANKRPERPPAVFSLRFYIMILALVSPFVVTYSRTIINFAIIDMIEPTYLKRNGEGHAGRLQTTTPRPVSNNITNSLATSSPDLALNENAPYFELDNSCPVDDATRERLLQELNEEQKQVHGGHSERFEWDTVKQGLLKSAYSIGHMLLQVAGGRLSEIYGPHLIMGSSAALIGLSCLAAPFLASAHFYLLFADLFFLGLLGSFMTPALITFFTNWLTPSEKSIMLSFYLVSSRLGYALSSLLCGLLIQAQLSWRYLFYSAGWISLTFSLLFFICARSRPHEHPLMRRPELDYLASKNTLVREAIAKSKRKARGLPEEEPPTLKLDNVEPKAGGKAKIEHQVEPETEVPSEISGDKVEDQSGTVRQQKKSARKAPWLAIVTNRAVWAFMITKFCVKLAGDTVQIELPTYLKRVMHLGARHNGIINASNYVIFCASCLFVGWLARLANKRRPFGCTKTTVRKVFQCTASCGVALSLLGISYFVCNETATLILLMNLFFFTTFGTGGEAQIPLDISERYAGTIHALGSQLAISGVIEPILVGFVLRDSPANRDRWKAVWLGASSVAFLGGLTFALFGDATIQPFDKIKLADSGQASEEEEEAKPEEALKRSSVELKGHINGSFQMKDEQLAAPKEGDMKQASRQSAEI